MALILAVEEEIGGFQDQVERQDLAVLAVLAVLPDRKHLQDHLE